jgi:nitronate monooxygenase
MDIVADGKLAATVSKARAASASSAAATATSMAHARAGSAAARAVGVGFITWSMAKNPRLLDIALERKPPPSCCRSAT